MAFGVLIVDDNPVFLEAARDLLDQEGLRVVGVAATSAEALQQAQDLRPGVVLVDIMLGGESGFELARRLAGRRLCGAARWCDLRRARNLDVQGRTVAGRADDRDRSAEGLDPVFEADDAGAAARVGAA
jgi:CheY-like chemotaxis protein